MDVAKELDDYMAYLMQGLGHTDRHSGLAGYCTGLMLPLSRKSVEPIAAYSFLMAQRLRAGGDACGKKTPSRARSVTSQAGSQRYASNWASPSQSPWGIARIAAR